MYFTDSSRGINIAKDPAVVRLGETYYMYYTISESSDIKGFDIGIATSNNLTDWSAAKVADF